MRFWAMVLFAVLPAHAALGQVSRLPDSAAFATVRAVLFYSPSCPHCRALIANGLPPLRARFGARLQIVSVDASTIWGSGVYTVTLDHFGLPQAQRGVPTLVVGSRVLVGGEEIPAELPGIVERGLAAGGVDWPDVSLLRQALASQGLTSAAHAEPEAARSTPTRPSTPEVASPAPTPAGAPAGASAVAQLTPALRAPGEPHPQREARSPDAARAPDVAARIDTVLPAMTTSPDTAPLRPLTVRERFGRDPIGNTVAVVVLVAMAAALVLAPLAMRGRWVSHPRLHVATVPVLALVGVGVASYLSYVELTGVRAICGPVGDCNTVQQSAYARLFGVPVGLLGIGGYVAMLVAWTVASASEGRTRFRAWVALWGMAWFATLFSLYLTFLEPFVIGATCAWCISSALLVALILLVATPAAARGHA